jgi:flagellar L-ring protein precursor FlgH
MRILPVLLLFAAPSAWCDSLYQPETFRALTSDNRAYRIGDALTVVVVENSSASNSADTTTEKRGSVGFAATLTNNADRKGSVDLNEDFAGKGKINRSGKLLATLTVNVVGHTENGDLLVAGSQVIELNGEKQQLQVDGRVRPVDIGDNNTVISSRIADARISYIGDGILGEKQRPGILTRFLSWLHIL